MSELRRSPGFWALALGATGGVAGFLGPLLLSPDANQGPMLGLFITGPGGALAGLVLGFFFRILPFTDAVRGQALTLFCVVLGAGTLWFSFPEPVAVANVIDGTIRGCRRPEALLPGAIARWEARAARVSSSPPRAGWRGDSERRVREASGAIVEIGDSRQTSVIEQRKPWNRGELGLSGWRPDRGSTEYYGAGRCDSYPSGRHVTLALTSHGTGGWPPEDVAMFLGLLELAPVPERYRKQLQ